MLLGVFKDLANFPKPQSLNIKQSNFIIYGKGVGVSVVTITLCHLNSLGYIINLLIFLFILRVIFIRHSAHLTTEKRKEEHILRSISES